MLKEGDKAPNFTLNTANSDNVTLSDFLGKIVIVYFYPKNNTPGCTKQACSFRDNYSHFKTNNIVVIGISNDSEKSHEKFINKYNLPFILLSDPTLETIKNYGVWQEKFNFGVKALGIVRTTFIVNEKGYIQKVFEKVKPDTNSTEILNYLGISSSDTGI